MGIVLRSTRSFRLSQPVAYRTFAIRVMAAARFRTLRTKAVRAMPAFFFAANRTGAQMGVFAVQTAADGTDATLEVAPSHLDEHFGSLREAGTGRGRVPSANAPAMDSKSRSLSLRVTFHGIESRGTFFTEIIFGVIGVAAPGGRRDPLAGHQTGLTPFFCHSTCTSFSGEGLCPAPLFLAINTFYIISRLIP